MRIVPGSFLDNLREMAWMVSLKEIVGGDHINISAFCMFLQGKMETPRLSSREREG